MENKRLVLFVPKFVFPFYVGVCFAFRLVKIVRKCYNRTYLMQKRILAIQKSSRSDWEEAYVEKNSVWSCACYQYCSRIRCGEKCKTQ